jgi:hypothetical protein
VSVGQIVKIIRITTCTLGGAGENDDDDAAAKMRRNFPCYI